MRATEFGMPEGINLTDGNFLIVTVPPINGCLRIILLQQCNKLFDSHDSPEVWAKIRALV
jgi:hypothetical protein